MEKKNKIRTFIFNSLLFLVVPLLVLAAAANVITGLVTAFSLNIDEIGTFDVEATTNNDTHAYRCYPIYDIDDSDPDNPVNVNHTIEIDSTEYPTVAISWLSYRYKNEDDTLPTSIKVPDYVVKEGTVFYVIAIAKSGFMHSDFTTITLPERTEEIREGAFAYCEYLTSFTIPYQITEIAPSTFLDCRSLQTIGYSDDSGASKIENSSIVKIGDHAFDSCVSLNNVICPESVLYFGKSCFQKCSSLASFDFPSDPGYGLYKKGNSNWEKISNVTIGERDPRPNPSLEIDAVEGANQEYYIDTTDNNKLYKCSVISEVATWALVQEGGQSVSVTIGNGNPNTNNVSGNANDYYANDNAMVIEEYAFSDCSSLVSCYFEENLTRGTISQCAFTDCADNLTFYFASDNDDPDSQIDECDDNNNDWRVKYIRLNGGANIPYILTTKRYSDIDYEGLSYTIKTSTIYLDSAFNEDTNAYTTNTPLALDSSHTRYAVITGFTPPSTNKTGYYVDGALTIPEYVKDIGSSTGKSPVKVIGVGAFREKSTIKSVKFNSTLVQIEHKAFYHTNNLGNGLTTEQKKTALDFSNCNNLLEISYKVFAEGTGKGGDTTRIANVTALTLPNSLKYIGDFGFSGFSKVTSLTLSSSIKVIGERAFANLGESDGGKIDLILPNSLEDAAADEANYYHPDHTIRYYPCAIGRHCFDNAKGLASVEMQKAEPWQQWEDYEEEEPSIINKDYTCSLGTSTFVRCLNLVRFVASENLWTLGASCFNTGSSGLSELREVFLTRDKAEAKKNDGAGGTDGTNFNYPWGINNMKTNALVTESGNRQGPYNADPMFLGASRKSELVIYVNGELPGSMGSNEKAEKWNVERGTAYVNGLYAYESRSIIPTYVNVDWHKEDGIFYWKPGQSGTSQFVSAPKTKTEYNNGVISIVKKKKASENDADEYIVGRYYCDSSHTVTTLDLSHIPNGNIRENNEENGTLIMAANTISNGLKTIGHEAIGTDSNVSKGLYVVLPYCVTTIGERAFFRSNNGKTDCTLGVRIVTARQTSNTGKIYKKDGSVFTDVDNDTFAFYAGKNGATNYPYYCYLPSGITSIGRNAFYNNYFAEVNLRVNSSSFFLGSNAFYSHDHVSQLTSFSLTDNNAGTDKFVMGTGTSAGGLYYSYTENETTKKILVYQAMSSQANASDRTLTLDSDTVAIGMHALANTNYTKITIPSSVTTLYGGALQMNTALTEVAGGTGIKYISATEPNQTLYTAIWNESMPFDITDWWNWKDKSFEHFVSKRYGFKDCSNLTKINFKTMTSLKKIGKESFANCGNMADMTGGSDTYYYWSYNSGTHKLGSSVTKTTGVLDLTKCTQLESISAGAFIGCSSIQFVHTPDTTISNDHPNGYNRSISSLAIGKNPDNSGITMPTGHGESGSDPDDKIFTGESNSGQPFPYKFNVLVGENVYQVRTETDPYNNKLQPRSHYYFSNGTNGKNWYGGTDGTSIYYKIRYPLFKDESKNPKYTEIYNDSSFRYWIGIPVKIDANTSVIYNVLFTSADDAKDFCGVLDSNPNSIFTQVNGYPCLDTSI